MTVRPTPVFGQLTFAMLVVSEAPTPESEKLVPLPALVFTVRVPDLKPVLVGLNLIPLMVHEPPEARVRFAAHVPTGTVKSVPFELVSGEAASVTAPPEAVRVTEPVPHVALDPV